MKQPVKNILIVEDEAIIGMALAADLEDLGYAITGVAGSGEEALELIRPHAPDLLLLDIKLRGSLDGIETLARIRQIANPKVIIISGNSEIRTYHRAQDMKVDGFIVKPVNMQDLQQLLKTI